MTLARGEIGRAFVIRRDSADHPGKFTVHIKRRTGDDTRVESVPVFVCDTIDEARAKLTETDILLRFPPSPDDGPDAVETWM